MLEAGLTPCESPTPFIATTATSPHRDREGRTETASSSSSASDDTSVSAWALRRLPCRRLREASPRQLQYAGYAAIVFSGYGFALFVNGSAKRFMGTSSVPSTVDRSSNLPIFIKLLHQQLEPMFYLSSYRMLAICALIGVLRWRGDVPAKPDALTRKVLVPVAIGLCNAGGYLFFNVLCALSGVTLWSSLIGCYVVVPVSYGLLIRKESRGGRKLAGIGLCIAAVVMLSLAQSSGGDEDAAAVEGDVAGPGTPAGTALRLVLFLLALGIWGLCDTMASYVAKGPDALHITTIAAGAGVGFGAIAWLCAALAYVIQAHAASNTTALPAVAIAAGSLTTNSSIASPDDATTSSTGTGAPPYITRWWGGQAVLVLGQCLGVTAWYFMVKLGAIGEASTFLPLVSTYTIFAALLGIAVLGESLSPMGYGGMATACAGVVLLGGSNE